MTLKSRKTASRKKSAAKSKSRVASSKRAISIKSVKDTAVLTREVRVPNNSANAVAHHAMAKFHNQVVDLLVTAAFSDDIFAEAKKIVLKVVDFNMFFTTAIP